ncbi:hypothetical protein CRYPA_614 [uncultured Candidatus Thioglobus sp.]|nr:hypothetical protein CRYPA_614 [uncultured Candidatus Thioglobus sp.]
MLAIASTASQASVDLFTISTRPNVTQQILVEQPNSPIANLILFSGGKGKIKLDSGKYINNKNFLVRSRQLFIDNNFITILIDAPSDK